MNAVRASLKGSLMPMMPMLPMLPMMLLVLNGIDIQRQVNIWYSIPAISFFGGMNQPSFPSQFDSTTFHHATLWSWSIAIDLGNRSAPCGFKANSSSA